MFNNHIYYLFDEEACTEWDGLILNPILLDEIAEKPPSVQDNKSTDIILLEVA